MLAILHLRDLLCRSPCLACSLGMLERSSLHTILFHHPHFPFNLPIVPSFFGHFVVYVHSVVQMGKLL